MMKAVWSGAAAAALVIGFSAEAAAQTTATKAVAVTVNVSARAKLTLGSLAVTFNDADPDVTPIFTSAAITIDVKARGASTGPVTLTMVANHDLTSGTDTIPISDLTWTVSGDAGLSGGAGSTTGATVGSWTGSGAYAGSHTFSLPNSWAYATGSYSATLTYTLSAP